MSDDYISGLFASPSPDFSMVPQQGAAQPSKFLSPQELAQLSAAFGGQEREHQLEQQLAQANALLKPEQQHTTGAGALLGGIASAMNAHTAKQQRDQVRAQQQQMLDQQRAVYNALLNRANDQGLLGQGALLNAPAATSQAPALGPVSSFGRYGPGEGDDSSYG